MKKSSNGYFSFFIVLVIFLFAKSAPLFLQEADNFYHKSAEFMMDETIRISGIGYRVLAAEQKRENQKQFAQHGRPDHPTATRTSSGPGYFQLGLERFQRAPAHRQRFCRIGSATRERIRNSCSSSMTENQYFRRMTPSSTGSRSKIGHWWRKVFCSVAVHRPMTHSTPKTTITRLPSALTHACRTTSSACRRSSSFS